MLNRFREFVSCVPDTKELAALCYGFARDVSGMADVLAEVVSELQNELGARYGGESSAASRFRNRVSAILSRPPEPAKPEPQPLSEVYVGTTCIPLSTPPIAVHLGNPEPQPEQREIVVGSMWVSRFKEAVLVIALLKNRVAVRFESGTEVDYLPEEFRATFTWLRDPEPQPKKMTLTCDHCGEADATVDLGSLQYCKERFEQVLPVGKQCGHVELGVSCVREQGHAGPHRGSVRLIEEAPGEGIRQPTLYDVGTRGEAVTLLRVELDSLRSEIEKVKAERDIAADQRDINAGMARGEMSVPGNSADDCEITES